MSLSFPRLSLSLLLLLLSPLALAAEATGARIDLTTSTIGYLCLVIFVIAYVLVIGEEYLHLNLLPGITH